MTRARLCMCGLTRFPATSTLLIMVAKENCTRSIGWKVIAGYILSARGLRVFMPFTGRRCSSLLVYLCQPTSSCTAILRVVDRRYTSKSLGNVIDPRDLISEYGT